MKVLVIGDVYVEEDYFASQIMRLQSEEPLQIKKYRWFPKTKEEFQKVAIQIERNGPEGIPYPEGLDTEISDADAIFTHFCPISKTLVKKAKKLKFIGTCRAGTEHIAPEAADKKISVVNVVRNAESVADFTVGLLLSEFRNISRSHLLLKQGRWEKEYPNSPYTNTLSMLKIGLIGFGAIGQITAKKLLGMGAEVRVYDVFLDSKEILALNAQVLPVSLDCLLKESDIISLHVRFEKENPPIIDRDALDKMKKNCILINTSRAYAIDEEALVQALENRKISGAALDVFTEEPLPADSALLKLENVTLTPHIAGDTAQSVPLSPKLLIDKIMEQKEHDSLF